MNTAVTTTSNHQESRVHEHPPQREEGTIDYEVRRSHLLDRLALRLGVALMAWGRRPRVVEPREARLRHLEQHEATLTRERAAQRMRGLSAPQL